MGQNIELACFQDVGKVNLDLINTVARHGIAVCDLIIVDFAGSSVHFCKERLDCVSFIVFSIDLLESCRCKKEVDRCRA